MAPLPLAQVKAGMILAKPVLNAQGLALVSEGMRLTPLLISRLEKWGIEEVAVREEEKAGTAVGLPNLSAIAEAGGPVPEKDFARVAAEEITERFSNVPPENQLMMQLRMLALKKIVEKGPVDFFAKIGSRKTRPES